jgi:hypothetical protein
MLYVSRNRTGNLRQALDRIFFHSSPRPSPSRIPSNSVSTLEFSKIDAIFINRDTGRDKTPDFHLPHNRPDILPHFSKRHL